MNQFQLQRDTSEMQISPDEREKLYSIAQQTWMVGSWIWTIIVTCLVGFAINFLTTAPGETSFAKTVIGALQTREPVGHVSWSVIIVIIMSLALIVTLLAFLTQQRLKPPSSKGVKEVTDKAEQSKVLVELQHISKLLEQTIHATQIQHREQVVVQRTTTQALNTIYQILQRLYQKSLEPVKIHPDHYMPLTEQAKILEALQHLEQLIIDTRVSDTQELSKQSLLQEIEAHDREQERMAQSKLQEPVARNQQPEPAIAENQQQESASHEPITAAFDRDALQEVQDTEKIRDTSPIHPITTPPEENRDTSPAHPIVTLPEESEEDE